VIHLPGITVLWPGLRGFDYSVAYAREWLPIASKNATVLNVFLFTASLHLETLRGPGSLTRGKIRTEQLYHKGEAIRGLNKALSDPNYCQSDEMIQNILFLAVNETGEEEEPADLSPFASPLQNVQWLGMYGTRSYAMSHVNAMQEIIRRRGGIRNIKAVGLPWLISL
jgi:Fungal specific transcription factor domain